MFWRVMFPMALPAVANTVILNFIDFWNEFLYYVPTRRSARFRWPSSSSISGQYQAIGMLATGLTIATPPVLIIYLFLSEWFVKGMTAGAIEG